MQRHTDCDFRHDDYSLPEELLVLMVRICAFGGISQITRMKFASGVFPTDALALCALVV